jgi:hypothetical protein
LTAARKRIHVTANVSETKIRKGAIGFIPQVYTSPRCLALVPDMYRSFDWVDRDRTHKRVSRHRK